MPETPAFKPRENRIRSLSHVSTRARPLSLGPHEYTREIARKFSRLRLPLLEQHVEATMEINSDSLNLSVVRLDFSASAKVSRPGPMNNGLGRLETVGFPQSGHGHGFDVSSSGVARPRLSPDGSRA